MRPRTTAAGASTAAAGTTVDVVSHRGPDRDGVLWAMTELPGGSKLRRSVVHPLLTARSSVKWLNHEASLDVAELEPRSRSETTYVLQEYFIPRRGFLGFAQGMAQLLRRRRTGAVNVSIQARSCRPGTISGGRSVVGKHSSSMRGWVMGGEPPGSPRSIERRPASRPVARSTARPRRFHLPFTVDANAS